jgi:hypothetical protein
MASVEFILGLLDREYPAHVAAEDLTGIHGRALRHWQTLGFLSREPGLHPAPSCPACGEGVPYPLGCRYLCARCRSPVDRRHLLFWRFDLEAFLTWLAARLRLRADVRQVEERLWQLGSLVSGGLAWECFFRRSGRLSDPGRQRLLAYRNALLLEAVSPLPPVDDFRGPRLCLVELLGQARGSLTATDLPRLLHRGGAVRFDPGSGAVWAGDVWLGEVAVGSREYHFLGCLFEHLDRFVAYADLKHCVLRRSGSADTTEEATFCQKLKGRIKAKRWVRAIDRLVVTTNKGDGYRLRGHVAL